MTNETPSMIGASQDFRTTEELQRRQDEQTPGFMEGVRTSVEEDWASSWLMKQNSGEEYAPDPEYKPTDELFTTLSKDIPQDYLPDYLSDLEDARSEAELKSIDARWRGSLGNEQKLASMGWKGTALRMAVSTLDPTAVAAIVASEGVLAPLVMGVKATKMARIARAGLIAGTENAAIEGYIYSQKPDASPLDVLIAGATGTFLGGVGGALINPEIRQAAGNVVRKAERLQIEEAGQKLTAAGERYYGPSTPSKLIDALDEQDAESTVGAAQTPNRREALSQTSDDRAYEAADTPEIWGKGFSMLAQGGQDAHPLIRKATLDLGGDPVKLQGDAVASMSAFEDMDRLFRSTMVPVSRAFNSGYTAWAKEAKLGWVGRYTHKNREDFAKQVYRAVISEDTDVTDPNVLRAASAIRKQHDQLRLEAQRAGVAGFEDVVESSQYMLRVHNYQRINDMLDRYGTDQVSRLVGNAYLKSGAGERIRDFHFENLKAKQSAKPLNKQKADDVLLRRAEELAVRDAHALGKGYIRNVMKRGFGNDVETARMFSQSNRDYLAGMMRDSGAIADDQIEGFITRVIGDMKTGGEATHARAKSRVTFDENYVEKLRLKDGVSEEDVRFNDIFQQNAEALFTHYNRQLTGAIALANKGFKSRADFDRLLSDIRNTITDYRGGDGKGVEGRIRALETMYRAVAGVPQEDGWQHMRNTLRRLRDWNFLRLMNQVGFAQISEFANITSHVGFRSMLAHMPTAMSVMKRAKDGTLPNELMDEIEAVWGIGGSRYLNSAMGRFDEFGVMESSQFSKADELLHVGKRITADISFMAPLTAFQSRLAGAAVIQRFTNMAYGGRAIKASVLRSLGISEEMEPRILAAMKDVKDGGSVRVGEGLFGRKIKQLNLDGWADEEARAHFVNAVHRWTRRAIQENDIGQLSQWMTTEWGKTIIQFRTFALVAYSKQFMAGLAHRDFQVFMGWSMAMLLGSFSYASQTYIRSLGRDDAEGYREKYLSTEKIATAALNRAAWVSLAPSLFDTAVQIGGGDPVFSHARSTGLMSNPISGNPTVDLIFNGLGNFGKAVLAPTLNSDYQFSQQDVRSIVAPLVFQNALGLSNFVNAMSDGLDLPTRSRND